MTHTDGRTDKPTASVSTSCDCEACQGGDLPVNPFVALRVAYGMLLGEEDFRTLMGNPRGKQMLHSAWLHGTGVAWGYDVRNSGVWDLEIRPGLAIDGVGRELHNEATVCLDVRDLVGSAAEDDDKRCATRTVRACVVAQFDSCLSAPVPTLADPCDVTRKHDDYSRVVERVKISLIEGCCPDRRRPYHRVRVLLGLDGVGESDEAGQEALAAQQEVAAAPTDRRAHELLCQFRKLAALDSIDLRPALETGDCYPTLFPVNEHDAAVVLACLEIDIRDRDGCAEIVEVRVDRQCRDVLLPTATIQELTCGLAPGVIGDDQSQDAGGPRVIGEKIELSGNGRLLVLPVTAPLAAGSVVVGSVGITSLSPDRPGGWVVEDIYQTRFEPARSAIVVELADRPVNRLIRIVVKGTGPRPIMGADPIVPLAGLVGGPPGTRHDGHDAVWTLDNRFSAADERADSKPDGTAADTAADGAESGAGHEQDAGQ